MDIRIIYAANSHIIGATEPFRCSVRHVTGGCFFLFYSFFLLFFLSFFLGSERPVSFSFLFVILFLVLNEQCLNFVVAPKEMQSEMLTFVVFTGVMSLVVQLIENLHDVG